MQAINDPNISNTEKIGIVTDYADKVGMDDNNRRAGVVLATEGEKEFMKHVFTNQHDSSKQLSYAQMRAMYG